MIISSILFLISAYLAYIEVGHAHFSRPRRELGWWIAAINLIGCIAFMIASTIAYVPRHSSSAVIMDVSNANLWTGAFCFALAAAFSMYEARHAGNTTDTGLVDNDDAEHHGGDREIQQKPG